MANLKDFSFEKIHCGDKVLHKELGIGELIGTLTLDGEAYPIKGISDKTAQSLHRTVCPNCGAPHSQWEAKCEYCGGYVDEEMNQIEIKLQTGDYSLMRWDGERWIQTPASL